MCKDYVRVQNVYIKLSSLSAQVRMYIQVYTYTCVYAYTHVHLHIKLTSLFMQDVCYGADAWCVIVAGKRDADGKLEKKVLETMVASKSKHAR